MATPVSVLSDLYQSIDDDFVTLQNLIDIDSLSPTEKLLFNDLVRIVEELRDAFPASIGALRHACSELENQWLKFRRDGMENQGLIEFFKYIPRLNQQLTQIEEIHQDAGSLDSKDHFPVLIVGRSESYRKLLQEELEEYFEIEFENDAIVALDKFIHKHYYAVVISKNITGMTPTSLLRAMTVVQHKNQSAQKIWITEDSNKPHDVMCRLVKPDRDVAVQISRVLRKHMKKAS